MTEQGPWWGCLFHGGSGHKCVGAAGAAGPGEGEGGLLQAVKGSAAGPRIAEHWSVSGLFLADFSCRIERFGRTALPGVFSLVFIFFLSLGLGVVFCFLIG